MNKKSVTLLILKEIKNTKKELIKEKQKIYFKTFKEQNKSWYNKAINYSTDFTIALERILNAYKRDCIDLIEINTTLFENREIEKTKKYKTYEYLDSKYNHVVVPDIKDKLLELNQIFKDSLNKAYQKYIVKGLISDAAGLAFKGLNMNFDFNKFDEKTRDYLKQKAIKWSKKVADTTEKSVKRQLIKGYEDGLSIYDIAKNLRKDTGFSFRRCELIAQTEVISSCNYADYISFIENPHIIGVKWSSSGDSKVRPTHKVSDGQKRKKGQPFVIGSSKLLYPGDSSLGAETKEVINCRCTLYPIFSGESLESTTIYDDKDVGSMGWLLRQNDLIQLDYLNSKGKQFLLKNGLLESKDINKPWLQIKKSINFKMIDNFNYLLNKKAFVGLHPYMINAIREQMSAILDFGLDNNKEVLCALGISKFTRGIRNIEQLKLFKNLIANSKNKGKIVGEKEENLKITFENEHTQSIDKQPDNSVILIHNHPNGITLSTNDVIMLLKHKSIKYIIAVGHNGEIYVVENDNRKKCELTDKQWNTQLKILGNYSNRMLHKKKLDTLENIIDSYEDVLRMILKVIFDKYNLDVHYHTSRIRRGE